MAAISVAYAIYTIFDDQIIALVTGIFWGMLIFFLDWYLIASLKKQNKPWKEFTMAFPRIMLAVFLAVVIARPLELKLFEKEINQEIEVMQQQNKIKYKGLVENEFDEINRRKEENLRMNQELDELEKQRQKLFEMIIAEAEGRSPTGLVGKGPVYREKKAEFDQITQRIKEKKKELKPLIQANNKRIAALFEEKDRQLDQGYETHVKSDGFLARFQAFGNLSDKNKTIAYTSWFIIILFICIESSPVIVKLISSRGPYDEFFEAAQYETSLQAKKKMAEIQNSERNHFEIENQKSKMQFDAEMKINKDFTDKLFSARSEIRDKKIAKWKEQELNNIEKGNNNNKHPGFEKSIEEVDIPQETS